MDKFTDRIFEIDLEAKQIIKRSEQYCSELDKRVEEQLESFRRELEARLKQESAEACEREETDSARKMDAAKMRYSSFESDFLKTVDENCEKWEDDLYIAVLDSLNQP